VSRSATAGAASAAGVPARVRLESAVMLIAEA
jgi:hypothetical protein